MDKKNVLNIQKAAIFLCALSTITTVSLAAFAVQEKDSKAKIIGTAGALLSGWGLGMTLGGYLSNPYRKRQLN